MSRDPFAVLRERVERAADWGDAGVGHAEAMEEDLQEGVAALEQIEAALRRLLDLVGYAERITDDEWEEVAAIERLWALAEEKARYSTGHGHAIARARSVRHGSAFEPPAWAAKWGEEPSWRRAALKLAHDVLVLAKASDGEERVGG